MGTLAKRHIISVGAALLLVVLYVLVWGYFDLTALFNIETLRCKQEMLTTFVRAHYTLAVVGFIVAYSLHGAFAMPATSFLMIAGGFLFGVIPGIMYSLIASLIGGTSSYYATRFLFGNALNRKYASQLSAFRDQLAGRYTMYLIMIRVIPIIPFFIANILCGLALVPVRVFWWTLVVGIFPSLCIYSFLGAELGALRSACDLVTPHMLLMYVLIALCSIAPFFLRRKQQI